MLTNLGEAVWTLRKVRFEMAENMSYHLPW